MPPMTGTGHCSRCHGETFLARNEDTGKIIALDPVPRPDGRWYVRLDKVLGHVAQYDPKHEGGFRGHELPCLRGERPAPRLVIGTMVEGAVHLGPHQVRQASMPPSVVPRVPVRHGRVHRDRRYQMGAWV